MTRLTSPRPRSMSARGLGAASASTDRAAVTGTRARSLAPGTSPASARTGPSASSATQSTTACSTRPRWQYPRSNAPAAPPRAAPGGSGQPDTSRQGGRATGRPATASVLELAASKAAGVTPAFLTMQVRAASDDGRRDGAAGAASDGRAGAHGAAIAASHGAELWRRRRHGRRRHGRRRGGQQLSGCEGGDLLSLLAARALRKQLPERKGAAAARPP